MNTQLSYILNRKRKKQYERVFQGIASGRKRALENWFNDIWTSLESTRDTVTAYLQDNELNLGELIQILEDKKLQFKDFSELFIINQEGEVRVSTYKGSLGKARNSLPNYKYGMEMKPYMYGPFIDEEINNFLLDILANSTMGQDETPDLLSLTYYAGNYDHKSAKECALEMQDTYVRLDKSIGELLDIIDKKVGLNNVLFCINSTGYVDAEGPELERYRIYSEIARGIRKPFLVFKNANVFMAHSGEFCKGDVAVEDGIGQAVVGDGVVAGGGYDALALAVDQREIPVAAAYLGEQLAAILAADTVQVAPAAVAIDIVDRQRAAMHPETGGRDQHILAAKLAAPDMQDAVIVGATCSITSTVLVCTATACNSQNILLSIILVTVLGQTTCADDADSHGSSTAARSTLQAPVSVALLHHDTAVTAAVRVAITTG